MKQTELAITLGVGIDTLKAWRSAKYKGNPLQLLPVTGSSPSEYTNEAIVEWLLRNPDYKNRVLASLVDTVPDPIEQTPVQPQPHGLFGIHTHQPQPAESLE